MTDNFDDIVASPFDGIIAIAPWIAGAVILLSIYMLIRALITLSLIKSIKHELSNEEVKFIKIKSTLHILFSAVFMACGISLIVHI